MMQNKRFAAVLVVLLLAAPSAFAQIEFPGYSDVVTRFYDTYNPDISDAYYIRFVKNLKGYWVENFDEDKWDFGNRQLFWDAEDGTYQQLNFPQQEEVGEFLQSALSNRWQNSLFDIFPCYNYTGWEQDVVDLLEPRSNLSENELYALGRAWSGLATNLLYNISGMADSSKMFPLNEFGRNQLTSEQLTQYRFCRDNAIGKFGKLSSINPDYQTIVGSISTKYHNEFMVRFLDLRIFQNEEEAMKGLPDTLYKGFWSNFAYNFLTSCDRNAILFTNGDNDTYPLLYAQAVLGIRPDVLVINLSLLNHNNYVNSLRYGNILESSPPAFILDPETYEGDKIPYVYIRKDNGWDHNPTLEELLTRMNQGDSMTLYTHEKGDAKILRVDQLEISLENGKNILLKPDRYSVTRGELLMLDIIQSNIARRPVCFVHPYDQKLGMNPFLELSGCSYRLVPEFTNSYKGHGGTGINPDRTWNQLMTNFRLDVPKGKFDENEMISVHFFYNGFNQLADYYLQTGSKDSCRMVVSAFLERFPMDKTSSDGYTVLMIQTALDCGMQQEGEALARAVIEALEQQFTSGGLNTSERKSNSRIVDYLNLILTDPSLLQRLEQLDFSGE